MKDRILEFLKKENKTSSHLAEEIGVQPSSISHILSGRNNPSLDFVIKMLEKYPFLSTDWLIFGKGQMYKEPHMGDLFETIPEIGPEKPQENGINTGNDPGSGSSDAVEVAIPATPAQSNDKNKVLKIVWFYGNNSFEEFLPRKD
ncbi:MAG: helix-turn-helix transcriptional regulator [Bacteroidales bacterium]